MQLKEEAATDHIAGRAILLEPPPGSADFQRERAAAVVGVLRDQFVDELRVLRADFASAVAKEYVHTPTHGRSGIRTQGKKRKDRDRRVRSGKR
jgi:hypothetical protein